MKDIGNTRPYSYLPNGQGWFGMNFYGWTTGKPFSGFETLGHQVSIRFDVQFHENFFMYTKLMFELGNLDDHFEINYALGCGVIF